MSPLRYNVLAIWISACVCVLCGCGGDKVETTGDQVLSRPTIDSTVLGMSPDLRLADSLLNNSYEDSAHTIYARLYGSQAELSDPEKRTLLLRLALTAVWKVSEAGDSAYQAVADLLRRYEVMAGSTEQVSLLESAELEVALGCLLAGVHTVYILPDGMLQHLPFEALVTAEVQTSTFTELPYLFHDLHIGYAISSGTLHRSLAEDMDMEVLSTFAYFPARSSLRHLFSGQSNRNTGFEDLPGAKREVEAIEDIFHDRSVRLHFKPGCTSRQFYREAAAADVLHLGIHAFADPRSRFKNGLVFIDTTLYARDLVGMPLKADLVVLSGCETGHGKEMRGEGLFNFARPFIAAGADQVIMSRWLLHDQTASVLMRYFYEYLHGGMPAHEALSEARRTFFTSDASAKTAHPYYWSLMCTR